MSINIVSAEHLVIGCFYRSLNNSSENNEQLNELILNLSRKYKKILPVEDFNFPHINWNTWSVGTKDNNSKESQLMETIRDSFLEQIIKQPTRYRCNEKSKVLDLVLNDNEQRNETLEYESQFGKSDHGVLSFDHLCKNKENTLCKNNVLL